ncbi:maltase 2-like isoform X1 [Rhopalosiphum maidis]|uniref:maltase 2-like isoform X1 n=2 Tax=Rhopalosiphum maidis TaxID=43146 RepID=UPI000F00A10C|nr:maltase 2-like isoform X1 [Rhopalosiphum maidis]XP_026808061.1 maltase 2-like isoform X1 [Rhopalosiphum maidis]
MMNLCYIIVLITTTFSTNSELAKLDWWQTSVIYQVYPRSFKDSNGDGVGDLKGIEEMAGHFNETGIGAIWLSPIFKSPLVDFGYDISDFVKIDSTFGTMEDFSSLQKKLKSLGVRILLDFVPNHSSDEHEWFQKSVKKIDPYTEYYVWLDGKLDENGNRVPPNNWRNFFGGSAWAWSPERGQYYLHQFMVKQPDLNYNSSALLEEMKNVLRFWLDIGVDGFRVDAVRYIIEDNAFEDEPLIDPNIKDDNYTYALLNHTSTRDQPGSYKMIEEFRAVLDEYFNRDGNTRLLLTEAYAPINYTMMYYSQQTHRAHMPFNFNFILYLNKTSSAVDIKNTINLWLDNMPPGEWANWVLGNHDRKRVATRLGQDMVDPMNTLTTMLPGTTITYNGEEIGMTDGTIRWDQTVDPFGRNGGMARYEVNSRDPCRTPFHWNNLQNAGFSKSQHTWLPVNSNHWYLNLAFQKGHVRSHYQTYKTLLRLRSSPTIAQGNLTMHTPTDWILILTRQLVDHETFYIVLNVGSEQETIILSELFKDVPLYMTVRSSSINAWQAENDYIDTKSPLAMRPKSSLVLSSGVYNGSGVGVRSPHWFLIFFFCFCLHYAVCTIM